MPENNQILSVESQLVGLPLAGPESFSPQQLAYLKRALGVDETVLWSGNGTATNSCTVSESFSNFEKVRLTLTDVNGKATDVFIEPTNATTWPTHIPSMGPSGAGITFLWLELSGTTLTVSKSKLMVTNFNESNATWSYNNGDNHKNALLKVIGIHRIAGGN